MIKRFSRLLQQSSKKSRTEVREYLAMGTKTFIQSWDTGVLVGCGNPLLDISAVVGSDMLQKYDLIPNNAILAEKKHLPLYDELVNNYNAEYIAGGAVQNTLRVCQWMLQKPFSSVFFGCVGKDKFALVLEEKARRDGVIVKYQYTTAAPTGRCAVMITGLHRTLCADLGAANHFSLTHLEHNQNWIYIEDAKYFYISGFFLTSCAASIMKVAHHAHINDKLFMFNLNAPFVSQLYMGALLKVLPFVDILFGNNLELIAFAEVHGWDTKDLKDIGMKLRNWEKANSQRPRIVVITQSASPVLVFQEGLVKEYEVRPMAPHEIVDTNGAGDAFVGGFISQLIMKKCLDTCIRCGIYTAQYIVGQSGCTISGKPNFVE